jgi:NAD(P)-dependent dehydrogenase (short-subunit alcohol dehydrogenase family)
VIDPRATDRRFENTHAIVTGGGRGICRAISLRLASEVAHYVMETILDEEEVNDG